MAKVWFKNSRVQYNTMDGKGKGWMAVGRMSLKGLSFLDSRRIPAAGASDRKLNDINVSSAIRLTHARPKSFLACVAPV